MKIYESLSYMNGEIINNPPQQADMWCREVIELSDLKLNMTQEVEPKIWIGGYLTYTTEITNNEDFDITNIIFKDVINPNIAEFVERSVFINGKIVENNVLYNKATGELIIGLNKGFIIRSGTICIIKYKMKKAKV